MNWILFLIIVLFKAISIFLILVLAGLAVPIAFGVFSLGILLSYLRDVQHDRLNEYTFKAAFAEVWSCCMKIRPHVYSCIQQVLMFRRKPIYQNIEIRGESDYRFKS